MYVFTILFLSSSLSSQSSIYFSGIGLSVLENAALRATSLLSSIKANLYFMLLIGFTLSHCIFFASPLVWFRVHKPFCCTYLGFILNQV
jgi:hypothetical protein